MTVDYGRYTGSPPSIAYLRQENGIRGVRVFCAGLNCGRMQLIAFDELGLSELAGSDAETPDEHMIGRPDYLDDRVTLHSLGCGQVAYSTLRKSRSLEKYAMHSVLATSAFERSADRAGLSEDERVEIECAIANKPEAGALIPGTGGARKVRFPTWNKGKSSGYRVVTYYAADDVPVFLLAVYSKGMKANLSQAERNELRHWLSQIADAYREGVKTRLSYLGRGASA